MATWVRALAFNITGGNNADFAAAFADVRELLRERTTFAGGGAAGGLPVPKV